MKLTTIILLSASIMASAKGKTQGVSISMKDAPIEKVFKEIKKQTGYTFMYTETMLKEARTVTIDVKNSSLEQALNLCFANQPFNYEIVEKTIVLKPLEKKDISLTTDNSPLTIAPPIDITGKVTDENGNSLAGASVKVKNSNKGTTTNNEGVFTLKGVDDDAVLEISYVGFETISIPVGNRSSIVTTLKQKPENLNEVVINKGYYKEQKKYSVGNVTQIDAKDIEKNPVTNPILALEGRVPGLFITQSAGFTNAPVNFLLQGENSIRRDLANVPFVVIDGVPFIGQLPVTIGDGPIGNVGSFSPLNYINPNDIESITILKDADATAIYGSKAANGAILITTKKGKVGKTKIDINVQQGWGKVAHKVDMMNTRQYLDMRYEAIRNDNRTITSATNNDLRLWDTTRYTDWQKELIGGTAKYSNVNAMVSGGTSAMQYLIGATYNRTTTVFPGDFDDKKGSIHFNINGASPNQRFKIQLSGSYMVDENQLPRTDLTSKAILLEPVAPPLYNNDGSLNWALNSAGTASWENPLVYTLFMDYTNTTKNLISNALISFNILHGLDFKSNFGYTNLQSNSITPVPLAAIRPNRRATTPRVCDFLFRNGNSYIIEPQLTYKATIAKGKLESLIGTSIQKNKSDILSLTGSGYNSDLVLKSIQAAPTVIANTSGASIYRYNALFARLNYILGEKYILSFNGRRDGSSRFGDNNKFHNFWSAGAGWIFTKEKVMDKVNFLSFGKLKASYGTTGNDQIPDYAYLSYYSQTFSDIPYQNTIGLYPDIIPNPYLQWEETKKMQIGIDLGFINDKILFNGSFSENRCSNQLLAYNLPTITGFSSISDNFPATVQNTSWEFFLSSINIRRKNFEWNSSLNLTIPKNKVISFPNIEQSTYASGFEGVIVGQPLGVIKTYKSNVVVPTSGSYQVYDANGNLTSSPNSTNDKTELVSTLPKFYGGIQNAFSYKGFELNFLFQFVRQLGLKSLYSRGSISPGTFVASNSNQPLTVLNRWQKPGDNTTIGRYSSTNSVYQYSPSTDDYTNDASYIRLKNVSLTWNLRGQLLKNAFLQNVAIYLEGQNLATITKYKGLDPETQSLSLPPLRILTVGVKLDF